MPAHNPDPRAGEARQRLHEAVQAAVADPSLNLGEPGAVVTRWHLTAEMAMPRDRMGLGILSNDVSGAELRSWEAVGMLVIALVQTVLRQVTGR